MDLSNLHSRVDRSAATNCPGGLGNFGFNSYDLMTFGLLVMGAVTGVVIVNTNKNENNNNNNDLQASIGGLTTNIQMASADQTSSQGAMITVPPTGTPVVVPLPGKSIRFDGKVELPPEFQTPGVSWQSDTFQLFDDGLLIEKDRNGTTIRQSKGLVAFGTIDERNVFHLLPPLRNGKLIDWEILRNASGVRKGKSEAPQVLPFDDTPVFVPTEIVDELYGKAIEKEGTTMVQIAAPEIGPPIVIPIGYLLGDGNVLLNDGMEIENISWGSEDRIIFPNGTIKYLLTNRTEKAKLAFGTISNSGYIQLLPRLGRHKTSLDLLRDLNVKPNARSVNARINGLANDELFRVRDKINRVKRETLPMEDYVLQSIKAAFSTLSVLFEMDLPNADHWADQVLCDTYNAMDRGEILKLVSKEMPKHSCFAQAILEFCQSHY